MTTKTKTVRAEFQPEGCSSVTLWCPDCKQGEEFDFEIPVSCVLSVRVQENGELSEQNYDHSQAKRGWADEVRCGRCDKVIWFRGQGK